jgi:excisionase family DNA binding protein
MTKLLKLKDAADLLSVSVRTIERWHNDGKIKLTFLPSGKRISIEELEAFVHRNNPSSPVVSVTTVADLARHGLLG